MEASDAPDIYLVNVGTTAEQQALTIAETLRDAGLTVTMHAGGGSFKSQMKKADKSGARYAVIIGDDEVKAAEICIKPMRETGEQIRCPMQDITNHFTKNQIIN
jgi:histidyl-tRNA synthetase